MKNIWAYGIIAALVIFMSGTVYFVMSTASVNVDLVYEDYYERTIGYDAQQERIDRGHSDEFAIGMTMSAAKDSLFLSFPEGAVAGTLQLYRTSDQKLDRMYNLPQSVIQIADLKPGQWLIRVEWTLNELPVYTEIPLWR